MDAVSAHSRRDEAKERLREGDSCYLGESGVDSEHSRGPAPIWYVCTVDDVASSEGICRSFATRKAVSDSLIRFRPKGFPSAWANQAGRGPEGKPFGRNRARPRTFLLPGPVVDNSPAQQNGRPDFGQEARCCSPGLKSHPRMSLRSVSSSCSASNAGGPSSQHLPQYVRVTKPSYPGRRNGSLVSSCRPIVQGGGRSIVRGCSQQPVGLKYQRCLPRASESTCNEQRPSSSRKQHAVSGKWAG